MEIYYQCTTPIATIMLFEVCIQIQGVHRRLLQVIMVVSKHGDLKKYNKQQNKPAST